MTLTVHLPEIVVPGKRLGRSIRHDPRSLRYLLPEADASTVQSVTWERHIPILDQGQVGSCTGNALTGALASGPLYDALLAVEHPFPVLDEAFALGIYSAAETLDGDGPYPPNDNGSSGLSVATVAKNDGYISGYQHATSVASAQTAIAAGPFIQGTYWMSGMDDPNAEGIVTATGKVRGGHEYVCREYDAARDLWWYDNSWSTSYGVAGRFAMSSETLEELLGKNGDVTALVPLSQPAPTPAPDGATVMKTFPADQAAILDQFAARLPNWHAAKAWESGTGVNSAARAVASEPHHGYVYLDAGTGRFVSPGYASEHPATTFRTAR